MAVNKDAVKYSSASSGSVSTGETIVAEQVEDAMGGCGLIMCYLCFNVGGAALFALGYIGAEPSLELVGGSVVAATNLSTLAIYWDALIAKFQPKNKNNNSSQ